MSISDVTSYSSTSSAVTSGAHHRHRAQGPDKDVKEGVDQLKQALQSGDLDTAQKAYDSLSKLQSDKKASSSSSSTSTSSTSSATDGKDDPLSKMLSSVGEALKTGDVSKAQQAMAQAGPPGGGRGGAGGGRPNGPPPGGGGPPEGARDAIGQLAQSLGSGNLSAAQEAYTSLTDALKKADENGTASSGSASSGSSSTSTTKTTSSASGVDRFKEIMGDLGSALQSGHISTAQSLFSSLVPRGSQGVNIMV
jgi:hypothetical protein